MASPTAPSAKLLPSNYEKGMLIDDEWMAGVSKETEGFSVFIVDHLAGEALLHRTFTTLDAALQLVNDVPRAWRYESTSGCSGDRCEEGKCKGEGCKIYTGPKKGILFHSSLRLGCRGFGLKRDILRRILFSLLLSVFLGAATVQAETSLSRTLFDEVLDESFPGGIAPVDFNLEDYRFTSEGPAPEFVPTFVPRSLEWVRTRDGVLFPRARVRLTFPNPSSALEMTGAYVSVGRRMTPLQKNEKGELSTEFFLPVVSGDGSEFTLHSSRAGKTSERVVRLERKPDSNAWVSVGASCSPFLIEIKRTAPANADLAPLIAECRVVRSDTKEGSVPALDLFIHWDGAGRSVRVNGVQALTEAPSYFSLRLPARQEASAPVLLETEAKSGRGSDRVEVSYRLPAKWPRGFVGVGMGPYRYRLLAPGTDLSTTTGVLTIYGSYQVSDSIRFTAFSATAIHRSFFSDTGFYLKTNSVKILDERIAISLMLGANLVGFKYGDSSHFKWGAPQGFEAVYRDAFRKNFALTVGAFIYPAIDGKSYYNTWLRYGTSSFFGEMNFISIRDRFDGAGIYSRSAGVSIGFPLARIF